MRGFNDTDSQRMSVFKWGDEGRAGICDIFPLKTTFVMRFLSSAPFLVFNSRKAHLIVNVSFIESSVWNCSSLTSHWDIFWTSAYRLWFPRGTTWFPLTSHQRALKLPLHVIDLHFVSKNRLHFAVALSNIKAQDKTWAKDFHFKEKCRISKP